MFMKIKPVISEKHQMLEGKTILTVGKIYSVSQSEFDFGGSEYRASSLEEIPPERRNREDEYGWWNLGEGCYVMEFSEGVEIPDGKSAVLQPWAERFPASATHSVRFLKGKVDKLRTVLFVSESGIKIKENARFSELTEL